MARLGRLERPTSGSGDQRQDAMSMIRLAWSCTLQHDSAWYSVGYGPQLDPSYGDGYGPMALAGHG